MVVGEFTTEIDLLVIGAGPGGYVAAIRAAQLGKNVTLVDPGELGGVCLNRGCIPSKALISAAQHYERMKNSDENKMGIVAERVNVNFAKVQEWKQGIVNKLTGGVKSLLKGNKITILKGEAIFTSANEVRVVDGYEGNRYKFEECIIATGALPIELPSFSYSGRILSSTDALQLQKIPDSLVVIGGGYIGVELGQTFAKFGTKVSIIETNKHILPGFERQLTQLVSRNLKKSGVDIFTGATAQSAKETDGDVTISYKWKGEEKQISAEYALVTVGRRPNTSDLGLESAGITMNNSGFVEVDHQCRTSVPHIFAIGDIVEGPALAHKASYEGKVAAEVISGKPSVVDYKVIPEVVFSEPELASVGLTESQAKDEGYEVATGKFPFGANGRALALQAEDGFVKVVADKKTGLLLGAQIVGVEASNLIAELALAIEAGATLEDVALTIHAHPTLGEISMEATEAALGQGIHSMSK